MAQPVQNINHSAIRSMFEREKLSGNNFNDWFRQLKLVLRVEKKMFVIEQPLTATPAADSNAQVLAEWNVLYDAYNEVACLMLSSMTLELHRKFENYSLYEMLQKLKFMFEKQAGVERFDLIQTFHACKQEEGKPVAAYVLQMKRYVDQLERLGYVLPQDLTVGLILNGHTKDFLGFVRNYNMHNMGKTIGELHAMLIEYENGLPKKAETPQVMMIKGGKIHKSKKKSLKAKGKGKANGKGNDKQVYIPKPKNPKPVAKEHPARDDTCHHCKEVGHWKRTCHVYLAELLKKKKQISPASSSAKRYYVDNGWSTLVWRFEKKTCEEGTCSGYIYWRNEKRIGGSENSGGKRLAISMVEEAWVSEKEEVSSKHKECFPQREIIFSSKRKNLTPPYTPQHNSVSERRNHTLLDMVRSMMNLTTPPLSFCDYALESATRILNVVPTKKVDKTLYELWYEKVPNLSYLKVWGCEALVKRDTHNKLQQRSVKCIFIGYPKETMGYYFYFPSENKIVVARYAEFFKKKLITQEVSGRAIDLKEIQDEDASPSKITNKIPMEVEGFKPPQEEVIPIRRSERTHRAPNRLCLNVETEDHSLGDINEPASYKAAMLDSESNKWIYAMNAEIQSMIDNMVLVLVDLPPGCKTVGSKCIFKKKTDMDGIVHTYKARLVAKGYTQLYGVDCEEMFSPVADIRAIRILISIAAYYDYEIWKMDVKTAFLNAYLDEDIYMVKPEGKATFILGIKIYRDRSKRLIKLDQNDYMDKFLKGYKKDNSKRVHIHMEKRPDLNKTQGASTPKENPGECHWTAVKNILKYLRNTKDVLLVYGGNPEAELRVDCYYDKNSKQSTTAMSATEAEYIVASEATMKAVWIRKFILGLGIVPIINEPIRMFCDNSAALHFANEPGVQRGARHYHKRYHYVRESIALGEIRFLKVHTDNNMADPFTKALSKGKLTQHARSMGLRLASSFI
nr:retrovirus-related Pol polyprotein from transposon TNT 1-94 [Tanacetum cinerariifolium]